jgi:fused signal recognition particle receptor
MNLAGVDPTVLVEVVAVVAVLTGGVVVLRRRVPSDDRSTAESKPTSSIDELPARGVGDEAHREVLPSLGASDQQTTDSDQSPDDLGDTTEAVAAGDLELTEPDVAQSLKKSRGLFATLRAARRLKGIDEGTWEDLEATMLRADVGVTTTSHVLESLRERVRAGEITNDDQLFAGLRDQLLAVLERTPRPANGELRRAEAEDAVTVWLVVGVNGVGKTTTIGKLAHRSSSQGLKVLLAAGDTFRAAAGEQLASWGDRSDADVVRGAAGGDPSAIIYDALERAKARNYDVVVADTAGRLHNKVNLVEELKKIRRVADKDPGEVTEVLLVIDATTGQNALVQARQFTEAVSVTGVVLTKLDGTAKGGVVVAIEAELGIPVRFIGVGEGVNDLVVFEPAAFIDALVGDDQLG